MHLPNIKFKKNITPEKDIFLRIAQSIKTNQLDSGAIPSNSDLSHDPWDHIEAIMGLNFLNDKESSDLAFKWLKNNQNKDGSWYAKYSNNDPIELNKPTHFGPYISVAALHYYKIFSDKDKLLELWETIDSAIDFSLNLQDSNGTIPWSVDKNNQIENDFLLTGASSILKSLECAIAISKILDLDSNKKWTKAYELLAYAIKNPKGLFDKTIDRSRFSMDWYYPIISGCLNNDKNLSYIDKVFEKFYVKDIGVKCVIEEPWITVAETCEFIVSLVIVGRKKDAEGLLMDVLNISDENGIPYMGWQYEENIFWPKEKPSWTSSALIIAADSVFDLSNASDLFTINQSTFY